jgi:aspartate carbamoyltransferase catalytic subunit
MTQGHWRRSEGAALPRHIVEVSQFQRPDLDLIFGLADQMRSRSRTDQSLQGRILATLFYEPSTRTRLSFESAMLRLGGQVISTENAREFSSAIKGETVEDTIRIVQGYSDAIVIRHFQQGAADRAASVSAVPVINAGDGPGEHPTQALLDLYTVQHELGRIDELNIVLVGDLKFGRAVRSLALLFGLTQGTRLTFVSPPNVPMGDDVRAKLDAVGVPYRDETELDRALQHADVVYQTRIQRERFESEDEYRRAKGVYVVNNAVLDRLPSSAVVLHPLPRVDELPPEIDIDPRSAYFRQAHNGVFVRMALLELLIEGAWSN